MKKSIAFLLFALSVTTAAAAFAQDAAMIQAARKEGSVAWYTSLALPSSTAIAQAFKTKYTGIDVEVHRTGSERVLQRVMQEAAAGIKNVDLIHTSDAGHFVLLKDKGLLYAIYSQGSRELSGGFQGQERFYFGMRATLSVIAYNPKIVAEKDAPHTWKDLLNSKWSGKEVTAHPGYSGIIMTHVLALVNVYGWEYFRDLAKNKLHLVQSANDPAGIVASGERPVGVNGAEYFYYKTLEARKSHQDRLSQRRNPSGGLAGCHRQRRAPSKRGEAIHRIYFLPKSRSNLLADKEGLYTGHPEVTYPADKPKLKDLKLLSADPDELEKRNAEIKKRFVEFFGA